jgi:hypothetical protein
MHVRRKRTTTDGVVTRRREELTRISQHTDKVHPGLSGDLGPADHSE